MTADSLKVEDFSDYLKSLKLDPAGKDPEVLLLTCIDYRFFYKVDKYIEAAGLSGRFDHVILAGAELGPIVDFPPEPKLHWQQFFLEHLALARSLHNIDRLLVLGHRDCGAYRLFGVLPENPDRDEETKRHQEQAEKLSKLVARFHSDLKVDCALLSLEKDSDPCTLQHLA